MGASITTSLSSLCYRSRAAQAGCGMSEIATGNGKTKVERVTGDMCGAKSSFFIAAPPTPLRYCFNFNSTFVLLC